MVCVDHKGFRVNQQQPNFHPLSGKSNPEPTLVQVLRRVQPPVKGEERPRYIKLTRRQLQIVAAFAGGHANKCSSRRPQGTRSHSQGSVIVKEWVISLTQSDA